MPPSPNSPERPASTPLSRPGKDVPRNGAARRGPAALAALPAPAATLAAAERALRDSLGARLDQLEVALRQSEERQWRATVDSVSDMIVLEDPCGRILRCNLATTRYLQLPFQTVVGLDLSAAFFGPPAAGATQAEFRSARATVRFPGHDRWFEIANSPLHGAAGRDASWVHVITDVTERRRFEEEAIRLTAAVEQTSEMLVIVSRGGDLQYANPAYCDAAGVPLEALDGTGALALPIAPPRAIATLRPLLAAARANRAWSGSFSVAAADGSVREIEATVSPVRTGAGEISHFVCVGRDVTESHRLEAIADAANMFEQAGFIFATLRHELGNPVNSAKTALTLLQRNLGEYSPETVASFLERTLAEIGRMEYLLRAFKSFGSLERLRIEAVAAAGWLQDFASLVGGDLSRRGIELRTEIAADLGQAQVDPRALDQALLNLVTNAADAVSGSRSPQVLIVGRRRGPRLEIRIEDNGSGIAKSDLPHLFKPFYTTKERGTGLGLAIVRKLLSAMSSTIQLDSTHGSGTVVTLSLPVTAASE